MAAVLPIFTLSGFSLRCAFLGARLHIPVFTSALPSIHTLPCSLLNARATCFQKAFGSELYPGQLRGLPRYSQLVSVTPPFLCAADVSQSTRTFTASPVSLALHVQRIPSLVENFPPPMPGCLAPETRWSRCSRRSRNIHKEKHLSRNITTFGRKYPPEKLRTG